MKEIWLSALNKTALLLLLNIVIGFALSIAWENTNLMNYWLTFALARYIFIDKFYEAIAIKTLNDIKDKDNESTSGK